MNKKIFGIAILTLFIDQISKILIGIFFHLEQKVTLIKHFFSIYYIKNEGAAWSLFANKEEFLIVVSLLAIFVIYRYMYNFQRNKRNNLAFGLILGGIFGNLIDRICFGYVRDFLAFQIFGYHYPIFNFADAGIVIGVFLLILAIIKGEDKHEKLENH